jgi:hypothetical protein
MACTFFRDVPLCSLVEIYHALDYVLQPSLTSKLLLLSCWLLGRLFTQKMKAVNSAERL